MLRYRSHAKINLYLDILPTRPDGYHDIETLFQSVGIYDTLEVSPQDSTVTLECSRDDLGAVENNLAYRAAVLLRDAAQVRQGTHIKLEKRIPVAAGLAGGSGNAAAALVACNELWGVGYDVDELCALGATLGADVPFCIRGGTMAAGGIGNVLHPLAPPPEMWAVLIHPAIAVSTPWVYKHPGLKKNPATPSLENARGFVPFPITPTFCAALQAYKNADWKTLCVNAMEAPVFAAHPALAEYKKRLLDAGCVCALMSGSGSTVFGLCGTETEARRIAETFTDVPVSCAPFVKQGVQRLE